MMYMMVQVHLMLSVSTEEVWNELSCLIKANVSLLNWGNVVKFVCLNKDAGGCILSKLKFVVRMISGTCQKRIAIVNTQSDKSMYKCSCSFMW